MDDNKNFEVENIENENEVVVDDYCEEANEVSTEVTPVVEESNGLSGKAIACIVGGLVATVVIAKKAGPKIMAKLEEGRVKWFKKRDKEVIEREKLNELLTKAEMWDHYQETLDDEEVESED